MKNTKKSIVSVAAFCTGYAAGIAIFKFMIFDFVYYGVYIEWTIPDWLK